MTYNMTAIDNSSGLGSTIGAINSATNGLPFAVFLVVLWVGTYVFSSNRNLDPGESFTTSSFVSALIGILSYFAGLTTLPIVILMIVMFFGGVVYLMFK